MQRPTHEQLDAMYQGLDALSGPVLDRVATALSDDRAAQDDQGDRDGFDRRPSPYEPA